MGGLADDDHPRYVDIDGTHPLTADWDVGAFDISLVDLTSSGSIDWSGGNTVYVPLGGDIQTYVTAAAAGDTLVLASGVYTITSSITVDKQLNIRGQGSSGFVTAPVTPSHGTLIDTEPWNADYVYHCISDCICYHE
jgi:hypothetical protein